MTVFCVEFSCVDPESWLLLLFADAPRLGLEFPIPLFIFTYGSNCSGCNVGFRVGSSALCAVLR